MEQKKMSKSDPSDLSRINMSDTNDQIINKIRKAKTDNDPISNDIKNIHNRPELENLLGIYSSLMNQTLSKTISQFHGKNFADFKKNLSEIIVEKISPISREIRKIQKDEKFIDEILNNGAEKAENIAKKKVNDIKKIIGF